MQNEPSALLIINSFALELRDCCTQRSWENKRVRMMKMVGEHVSRGWLGCMQCSSTVVRPFSMAVVSISNGSKYARWLVRIGAGILYVR